MCNSLGRKINMAAYKSTVWQYSYTRYIDQMASITLWWVRLCEFFFEKICTMKQPTLYWTGLHFMFKKSAYQHLWLTTIISVLSFAHDISNTPYLPYTRYVSRKLSWVCVHQYLSHFKDKNKMIVCHLNISRVMDITPVVLWQVHIHDLLDSCSLRHYIVILLLHSTSKLIEYLSITPSPPHFANKNGYLCLFGCHISQYH